MNWIIYSARPISMQYNTLARKFDIIKKFEGTVAYKYVDACSYTSSSSTEGIAVIMRTTCLKNHLRMLALRAKVKRERRHLGNNLLLLLLFLKSASLSPFLHHCWIEKTFKIWRLVHVLASAMLTLCPKSTGLFYLLFQQAYFCLF